MIKCKVCGRLFGKITQSHLDTHGLSYRDYIKLGDQHKPIVIEIDKGGRKTCRVCGHTYQNLCKKHLHGMTREEYDRLPPFQMDKNDAVFTDSEGNLIELDSASLDRIVPWIRDAILKRGTLPEQARDVLANLQTTKEDEFKAMVTAMAVNKMERLPKLMDAINKIDDKLCDEVMVDKLTANGAMQLLRVLSAEMDKILGLFKDLGGMNPQIKLTQKNIFNELNIAPTGEDIPVDVHEREKIVKVYGAIVSLLGKIKDA